MKDIAMGCRFGFKGVERLVLIISCVLLIINLCLLALKPVPVYWLTCFFIVAFSSVLIGIGLFYRLSNRSQSIADAIICTGLIAIFSLLMSSYSYLLLPIRGNTIDTWLVWVDHSLGFSWPDMMAWMAQHPTLNGILKFSYMTTMPQLALLVIILGLSGKERELHQLLLMMVIGAVGVVVFWGLFPSLGAKSVYMLPDEIWHAVNPIVDKAYAEELIALGAQGADKISPYEIRGLVAFPSFHAAKAIIGIIAARNIKWLFPILLVNNLLILPASPVHGGHHLIDIPAGVLFAIIVYFIARKLTQRSSNALEIAVENPVATVR